MSALLALVPPELCAAALRMQWPSEIAEQVRCIEAGTKALGLATSCAPWSCAAEDRALAAELDGDDLANENFGPLDEVAAYLAATPGARPVCGLISGPSYWAERVSAEEDALDIASDLAAARVGALASAGVTRIVVVEQESATTDPGALADAHRPILRAARHLELDPILLLTGRGLSVDSFEYERWVGPLGCCAGLAYLSADALDSCSDLAGRDDIIEVVAGPLAVDTSPDEVRNAAAMLSSEGAMR